MFNEIIISSDLHSALDPELDGYLLHAWCPEGSRQLRDRTLSLEDVADLFHFSSLSHFSRYVQNNLGAPPSSFRE